MKNKPLWYKVWAIALAVGAIYSLIKYFFFALNDFDRYIQAVVLMSLLIDRFVVTDDNDKLQEAKH